MDSTDLDHQAWPESLSTEETASDDIQDNHSVVSDVVSQLSMRSNKRHVDTKKLLSTIQKLKQENISLKDALDATNLMDLATMKNKLRGANADLIRLRQTNSELKERIQSLERKIFDMVTSDRDKTEKSSEAVDSKPTLQSVKEKLKFLKRSQLSKENQPQLHQDESSNSAASKGVDKTIDSKTDRVDDTDQATITLQRPNATGTVPYGDYLATYNKSRHFERLARSLQTRLDLLQMEIQKEKDRDIRDPQGQFSSRRKSIEFAEAKEYSIETSSNNTATQNQSDKKLLLQQAKDANTIRELASEVKRLTSLLSRTKIEEEESMPSSARDEDRETNEEVEESSPQEKNSTSNVKSSKPSTVVVVQGYSLLFVICMFLIGILMVLVPLVIRHPDVSVW